MKVKSILAEKGTFVATIAPEATVTQLCELLTEHNIGAAVVASTSGAVVGIASERDVVRAIARRGHTVLDAQVREIMTDVVAICEPDNSSGELMATMTQRRIRHVPVYNNDVLEGIVSIGDVVRVTLEELEEEKAALLGYITS